MIDFQLVRRSIPEYDCVYFMAQSLPTSFRRKHELELMNIYYDMMMVS
jgi:hypothetical protein